MSHLRFVTSFLFLERFCEVIRNSENEFEKLFEKCSILKKIRFSSEIVQCKKIAFLFNSIPSYLMHCLVFAHREPYVTF